MSEEEKEAIDFLLNVCADDCINDNTISIILNLIEKLQKENAELKEKIKEYEIGIVKE